MAQSILKGNSRLFKQGPLLCQWEIGKSKITLIIFKNLFLPGTTGSFLTIFGTYILGERKRNFHKIKNHTKGDNDFIKINQ